MADTEKNKQIVLEFLEAFTTFDAAVYEPYLTENPVYWVGMTKHEGREGFGRVAYFGRCSTRTGRSRAPSTTSSPKEMSSRC